MYYTCGPKSSGQSEEKESSLMLWAAGYRNLMDLWVRFMAAHPSIGTGEKSWLEHIDSKDYNSFSSMLYFIPEYIGEYWAFFLSR